MDSNIKECLQMAIDHLEKDIEAEESKSKNNSDTINEKIYTKDDFMLTPENEYSKICEAKNLTRIFQPYIVIHYSEESTKLN